MKTLLLLLIGVLAAVDAGLPVRAMAQSARSTPQAGAVKPPAAGQVTLIDVRGKVAAISKNARVVSIEGAGGSALNLMVDNPNDLKAIKVGDSVSARYYEVVSIRKKRANESASKISLAAGLTNVQAGEKTTSSVQRKIAMVFPTTAVDQQNGTLTIKGFDGSLETLKAKDADRLEGIKPGDELVITNSRAVAMSLRKS